ncbi:hypothetical protein [Caenimonas koreensis]|uniref:hypothetical protein n=1 Tax=Caenimonas koreensis TaxID=367474 RepID=UPI0037839B91
MKFSSFAKTAAVALVVAGAAGAAQARSNVFFSVSAPIAPGVVIGASNAPYYPQVYSQPYYAPAPVYYSSNYYPAEYYPTTYYPTTYYQPTYYVRPAPVIYGGYYGRPVYRAGHYRHHGYR